MKFINVMHKISIITPTFNSSKTLRYTLDGLLKQTFSNFEYIIIDGKSTDDTLDIVKSYLPLFEQKGVKVTLISEKDNGVYDAMNKGISKTTGELIGINNSDDIYEKDALQIMWDNYSLLSDDEKQNSILYGIEKQWEGDLVYNVQRRGVDFISHGTLPHSTFFVPKVVYDKCGVFDMSYRILADYDFYSRCYIKGIKLRGIDQLISNYKLGGLSSAYFLYYADFLEIQNKYGFISKKQYNKKKKLLKIKRILNNFFHWW